MDLQYVSYGKAKIVTCYKFSMEDAKIVTCYKNLMRYAKIYK